MSTTMKKFITLRSYDSPDVFEVEEAVALQSQTIKHLIEDGCAANTIPLANVTCKILAKVIEYCKKHVAPDQDIAVDQSSSSGNDGDTALKEWDQEFVKELDIPTLFDVILAANYLNIAGLLELTIQTVADTIKEKTPEEIRKTFNIENDFTPEEEEKIRRENQWAFQ